MLILLHGKSKKNKKAKNHVMTCIYVSYVLYACLLFSSFFFSFYAMTPSLVLSSLPFAALVVLLVLAEGVVTIT